MSFPLRNCHTQATPKRGQDTYGDVQIRTPHFTSCPSATGVCTFRREQGHVRSAYSVDSTKQVLKNTYTRIHTEGNIAPFVLKEQSPSRSLFTTIFSRTWLGKRGETAFHSFLQTTESTSRYNNACHLTFEKNTLFHAPLVTDRQVDVP